jgi:hypothetical protein
MLKLLTGGNKFKTRSTYGVCPIYTKLGSWEMSWLLFLGPCTMKGVAVGGVLVGGHSGGFQRDGGSAGGWRAGFLEDGLGIVWEPCGAECGGFGSSLSIHPRYVKPESGVSLPWAAQVML